MVQRRFGKAYSVVMVCLVIMMLVGATLLPAAGVAAASPTVGTSTSATVGDNPYQTRTFYAQGLYWAMFSDGTDLVYSTSADGATWAATIVLKAGVTGTVSTSWCLDGTDVHLLSSASTYRKGALVGDGTINWYAAEQDLSATCTFNTGTIAVDSNHLPYITGRKAVENKPYIARSSTTNGTWTFDAGAPWSGDAVKLSDTTDGYYTCIVLPMTDGKMYVIYGIDGGVLYGQLWNGATFSVEQTVSDQSFYGYGYASATAIGDSLFITYWKAGIWFDQNTAGTWGVDVKILATVTATTAPVIMAEGTSGVLMVFWLGNTTANTLSYMKRVVTTWDASPTVWVDESVDTTPDRLSLSGNGVAQSGRLCLLYRTLAASPYDVNFAFLATPTITTGTATPTTMDKDGATAITFNPNLTGLGNAASIDVVMGYGTSAGTNYADYALHTTASARDATGAFTQTGATNLTPGETYYYRAFADGGRGSGVAEFNFTLTMPTVAPTTPTINGANVTLNGSVSNMQAATSTYVRFNWGYTAALGTTTTWQTKSTATAFSQAIAADPSQRIYYRTEVRNGAVTTNSATSNYLFTTPIAQSQAMANFLPIIFLAAAVAMFALAMASETMSLAGIVLAGIFVIMSVFGVQAIQAALNSLWGG